MNTTLQPYVINYNKAATVVLILLQVSGLLPTSMTMAVQSSLLFVFLMRSIHCCVDVMVQRHSLKTICCFYSLSLLFLPKIFLVISYFSSICSH